MMWNDGPPRIHVPVDEPITMWKFYSIDKTFRLIPPIQRIHFAAPIPRSGLATAACLCDEKLYRPQGNPPGHYHHCGIYGYYHPATNVDACENRLYPVLVRGIVAPGWFTVARYGMRVQHFQIQEMFVAPWSMRLCWPLRANYHVPVRRMSFRKYQRLINEGREIATQSESALVPAPLRVIHMNEAARRKW